MRLFAEEVSPLWFWIGLAIALVAGLLSIGLSRDKIARKYPRLRQVHVDVILLVLLVLGLLISALDHQLSEGSTAPPSLGVDHLATQTAQGSVSIVVYLRSSKNMPVGQLAFSADLPQDSSERILDFWPAPDGGPFLAGDGSKVISPDGKKAVLRYQSISGVNPVVEITLTARSDFTLSGNFGPSSAQIKAEQE